jgi:tRNA (mo5U34)-methyltransferase
MAVENQGTAGDLAERARAEQWYHTMELAPGVVTEGMFDLRPFVDRYQLPDDLTGKRVLDVGTFDGFWAFELERRGAQVTALDIDRKQDMDWPPRLRPPDDGPRGQTFRLAHEAYGSNVERVGLSIYDSTPERLGGKFDIVFCGSVLIHLRDPMLALERMAGLCGERLIICEEYSKRLSLIPGGNAVEFRGNEPWMVWWRPAPGSRTSRRRIASRSTSARRGAACRTCSSTRGRPARGR